MILLVGGQGDGEWVPDRGMATFPRIVSSVVIVDAKELIEGKIPPPHTVIENYVRQSWEDNSVTPPVVLPLYVHESLTLTGALLRLMVHYKPKG